MLLFSIVSEALAAAIRQKRKIKGIPIGNKELRPTIAKCTYIKLKLFYTAKETINGVKKPSKWQRIFASSIPGSRIGI